MATVEVGVMLDFEDGVQNGSVTSVACFECGPRRGIFMDAGFTQVSSGERVGVTLGSVNGLHGGSVTGVARFVCGPIRGIFADVGSPGSPPASGSAPRWTP